MNADELSKARARSMVDVYLARLRNNEDVFQAYSLDTEDPPAMFMDKYGREPEEVEVTGGTVLCGPVERNDQ